MRMSRIAGKCIIEVDGVIYRLAGTLTCSVNPTTRSSEIGLSGPAGYSELGHAAYIEGEFYLMEDVKTSDLYGVTDATIRAELPNHNYILSKAYQVGDIEVNAANGTFTCRFEAASGQEIIL